MAVFPFIPFVLGLVSWLNVSYLIHTIIPGFLRGDWHRAAPHLAAQVVVMGLALRAYFLAIVVHPGRVPREWVENHQVKPHTVLGKVSFDDAEIGTAVSLLPEGETERRCGIIIQKDDTRVIVRSAAGSAAGVYDGETGAPPEFENKAESRGWWNAGAAAALMDADRAVMGGGMQPLQYTHKWRWCQHCCHWKPPRAHHCSICKQCILRYDHHCPWIANCVGFHNHKQFLLLITYMPIACWHVVFAEGSDAAACLGFEPIVASLSSTAPVPCLHSGAALVNFSLSYIGVVLFGVLLTVFGGQHLFLLSQNKTTVETLEKEPPEGNIYDVGCWGNYLPVCGPEAVAWPVPAEIPPPDSERGVTYAISASAVLKQHKGRGLSCAAPLLGGEPAAYGRYGAAGDAAHLPAGAAPPPGAPLANGTTPRTAAAGSGAAQQRQRKDDGGGGSRRRTGSGVAAAAGKSARRSLAGQAFTPAGQPSMPPAAAAAAPARAAPGLLSSVE